MDINSVSSNEYVNNATSKKEDVNIYSQQPKTTNDDIKTKTDNTTTNIVSSNSNSAAVYEKSNETKDYDKSKIQQLLRQSDTQMSNFKKLINSVITKQSNKIYNAMPSSNLKDFFSNLEVDNATRLQAQNDISENGYYGVNKTSERILDFAKAYAGNDANKISEMRTAVEKGFKKAEDMWGGTLPDISQKTYDKIMSEFDNMEKSPKSQQNPIEN